MDSLFETLFGVNYAAREAPKEIKKPWYMDSPYYWEHDWHPLTNAFAIERYCLDREEEERKKAALDAATVSPA